jgi:prepilin-type N-terminal cleavage/methylation domain-containing protein
MKTRRSETNSGFTLMELMVVVALIAILATMVLAAGAGIMKKVKRDQIRQFMAELEAGLENYKIDNGLYPLSPENPAAGTSLSDGDAREGAEVLYKYLSGDFDLDGKVDDDERIKQYVERLDWWSNMPKDGKTPAVQRSYEVSSGEYMVIDPLGSPMRYLAAPPGFSPDDKKKMGLRNPTFDLWSLGGGEVEDQAKWITNWGTH